MKKQTLFITLFLLVSITTFAQKKFVFGVKGGINITNMTSNYFSENKSKTQFYIGVLTEFSISNTFSIQPEILYAKQGADVQEIVLGGPAIKTEYSLDYFQIPVLAKINVQKNISIELGPSFNFLVNDKKMHMSSGNQMSSSNFGKKFELGAVIGASYKFENGFFSDLRYTKGLTNVFGDNAKNNSFQIGIGFLF